MIGFQHNLLTSPCQLETLQILWFPALVLDTRRQTDIRLCTPYRPALSTCTKALSCIEQNPQSMRRNGSPVKLINGLLLLCPEHLSGALVELVEIAQTPSRPNGIFHRPPKAFHRVEMVTAMGG